MFNPRNFKAPFITKETCWLEADAFRERYWPTNKAPVDVLKIAEHKLDLEIETLAGLREDCDADALLSLDRTALTVDLTEYMEDRFYNKLRFSVAHELGHYVLHTQVYDGVDLKTPREWIEFVLALPDDQYGFLEYHANEFAGRLLVPKDQLIEEFEKAITKAETAGFPREKLNDALIGSVAHEVAKAFEVSPDVIERRLYKGGIWPF